jgi:hypothetical protein
MACSGAAVGAMSRGWGVCRAVRLALAVAVLLLARIDLAVAQSTEGLEVSDTLFTEKPKEPLNYTTTYDLNVSRGTWSQLLSYYHNSPRSAFSVDANVNTLQAVRGLESNGLDGSLSGRLNLRATNRWIWSLDGNAQMYSNSDDLSSTDRRQNRLQARTQYTANPWQQLTITGILFSEFQEEQSIGARTIPGVFIDTTATDTTTYRFHSTRDSSYTSGRRDGILGSLRWTPASWLDVRGHGSGTYLESKTKTLIRDFYALNPGDGATLTGDTLRDSTAPNGDRRYDTNVTYTGLARTNMNLALTTVDGDQEYYLLTKRAQEHVNYESRGATIHLDHAPFTGAQITIDGTVGRTLREYILQKTLNSLVNSQTIAGNFMIFRETSRASLGLQVGRALNERQVTQNGTIINRAMNVGAAKRVTQRLWLDATGNVTLYSRKYDDKISDRDDVRGYANVGGGYLVSPACSTAVHFSTNRSHAVAIDAGSSAGNNIQTTYQMDALLKLQVSRSFSILQYYLINANYLIYDFDELPNTTQKSALTRIRRIDTILSDSLFTFAFIRLTHNFFFQDRGTYERAEGGDMREYAVAQQTYQQNLGLTVGVRPFRGITLSATQSLANTRNYFPTPSSNTKRNRWNLNLGATVDRELPGDMTLQGSVQHIGEYTERPSNLPSAELVSYWLAGATFTKVF